MITLDVEDYCHNCPDFEAVTTRTPTFTSDSYIPQFISTVVHCEHSGRCRQIAQHIRHAMYAERKEKTDADN